MDLTVVGAGVMGLAVAVELARRGMRVTLRDRGVVGNELASSIDRSKVFRFAYPDPFYADLGRRALPLWRELERDAGEPLLEHRGALFLDELAEFRSGALDAMREPLEEGRITIARGGASRPARDPAQR